MYQENEEIRQAQMEEWQNDAGQKEEKLRKAKKKLKKWKKD